MTIPPLSLQLVSKQGLALKQTQRLMMSSQMQQAIQFLQLPILELSTLIEAELEQNPVMDYMQEEEELQERERREDVDSNPEQELIFNERDFEVMQKLDDEFRDYFAESGGAARKLTAEEEKRRTFQESLIIHEASLFEDLMQQAHETFETSREREMAEAIIGNLDKNGFLDLPLEEIAALNNFEVSDLQKIVKQIQNFEPFGVGAKNLQESLLIQLTCLSKDKSLAYQIIAHHFDDLLHNRILLIKKKLHCSTELIEQAIKHDIAKLDLHPGCNRHQQATQYVIPDALILQEEEELIVSINDDQLPPLKLNTRYTKLLEDETLSIEAKEYIKKKIGSAKWLIRNLYQRNETLERVVKSIASHQKNFFLHPEGLLKPLTMMMLAEELELHESTVARAVSNKYVNTPRGLFPLRYFFTHGYASQEGADISAQTVKEALQEVVEKENKCRPYSDAQLSLLLKEKGMNCARRTVNKYRLELKIGNTQQRRRFNPC